MQAAEFMDTEMVPATAQFKFVDALAIDAHGNLILLSLVHTVYAKFHFRKCYYPGRRYRLRVCDGTPCCPVLCVTALVTDVNENIYAVDQGNLRSVRSRRWNSNTYAGDGTQGIPMVPLPRLILASGVNNDRWTG